MFLKPKYHLLIAVAPTATFPGEDPAPKVALSGGDGDQLPSSTSQHLYCLGEIHSEWGS
jgi:hypothetical protein